MSLDPFAWLIIPFLIPAGVVFVAWTLVVRMRALRDIRDPRARSYLRWTLLAHAFYAYAALVLSLLSTDALLGMPWHVGGWWPLLGPWSEGGYDRLVLLLAEVVVVLALALAAVAAARLFGHFDEDGGWRPGRG